MLKVLLVQPANSSLKWLETMFGDRNFGSRAVKRITFPLGLMEIGSVLEKNKINVKIVDLDRYLFYFANDKSIKDKSVDLFLDQSLIKEFNEYAPDVIGFSGNYNTNAQFIERCCKEVKKLNKDVKIVVGGHYFTNSYRKALMDVDHLDYVVLGEGEEVMLELVRAIENKDEASLDKHRHVVTKANAANNSIVNKSAAMVADLETLPPINYPLLDNVEDYLSSKLDMHTIVSRGRDFKAVTIMTSRGCPHSCTYCASYQVHGKKMRAFSVDRVIDEIDYLVKNYDINTIAFEDDLFTYSRKRTIEMCQKIVERWPDRFILNFPNGIAVYTLNDEVVYWMAKAGMKEINLAVESGNQFVQDVVIKKKIKLETVKPVVDLLKKHGVFVRAYFILGFPGETLDMMRDTKNFSKELKLDWSIFSFATPIAGSELYAAALRNNNLVSDNLEESTYADFRLKTDDWEPQDVVEVQEEANYECNFLENYNLVEGDYQKSKIIFEEIVDDYPKHLLANYSLWRSLIGLGEFTHAAEIEKRLQNLIQADERNMRILKKYDLLGKKPFSDILVTASV